MLFVRFNALGSGATESPDSRSSFVVILVNSFFVSTALIAAGWIVGTLEGFGFEAGCWLAKFSTMSAPGLDLPSLSASDATVRGLDHKPADGDGTALS